MLRARTEIVDEGLAALREGRPAVPRLPWSVGMEKSRSQGSLSRASPGQWRDDGCRRPGYVRGLKRRLPLGYLRVDDGPPSPSPQRILDLQIRDKSLKQLRISRSKKAGVGRHDSGRPTCRAQSSPTLDRLGDRLIDYTTATGDASWARAWPVVGKNSRPLVAWGARMSNGRAWGRISRPRKLQLGRAIRAGGNGDRCRLCGLRRALNTNCTGPVGAR
jgi:hypothetical protein